MSTKDPLAYLDMLLVTDAYEQLCRYTSYNLSAGQKSAGQHHNLFHHLKVTDSELKGIAHVHMNRPHLSYATNKQPINTEEKD